MKNLTKRLKEVAVEN